MVYKKQEQNLVHKHKHNVELPKKLLTILQQYAKLSVVYMKNMDKCGTKTKKDQTFHQIHIHATYNNKQTMELKLNLFNLNLYIKKKFYF